MALISPYVTLRAAWPLPGVGFFGPSSGFYCIGYSVFTLFRVTHTSGLPASHLSIQDSPEPRLVPREGLNTYILSLCIIPQMEKCVRLHLNYGRRIHLALKYSRLQLLSTFDTYFLHPIQPPCEVHIPMSSF